MGDKAEPQGFMNLQATDIMQLLPALLGQGGGTAPQGLGGPQGPGTVLPPTLGTIPNMANPKLQGLGGM